MFIRLVTLLLASLPVLCAAEQQFADLGALELASGEVIRDCRIGYRTYGELNEDKSNAVLWPTWFSGTTETLDGMVGPGKLVDSTDYYVVTVDALGNGVSCSPSNSASQKDGEFPRFTIGDMVESQHRLLTEILKIEKLHAVFGISMGGMQTFEWMVAHPGMIAKAIPIVGTPAQTSMDLLLWGAELGIIEAAQACNCGRVEAMKNVGRVHSLALETPAYRVRETPPAAFEEDLGKQIEDYGSRNDYDWASQLRAMMDHDIYRRFSGSLESTVEAVRADVFIVVAKEDHMVNPELAARFARAIGAPLLTLQSDCGHRATGCESELLNAEVKRFLDQ